MTPYSLKNPTSLIVSIATICIATFFTISNLSEFYTVGILKQTMGYPFGSEGPVPYYYQTAELYSIVNLIWGLIFLTTTFFAIKSAIKRETKKVLLILGITLFLYLIQYFHGQIGA